MTFLQRSFLWILCALLALAGWAMAEEDAVDDGQSLVEARQSMIDEVYDYELTGDPNYDYATLMVKLKDDAIDMANWMLKNSDDDRLRGVAEEVVNEQQEVLESLGKWRERYSDPNPRDDIESAVNTFQGVRDRMAKNRGEMASADQPERAFADGMLWHYEASIAFSQALLQESTDAQLRLIATDVSRENSRKIANLTNWIDR